MGRQALDRLLEQAQLIRVEGVKPAEALAIQPALELNRAIPEAEQGGEVLLLLLVDRNQLIRFIRVLGQQAPLDHLLHIGAGQGELGLEAALDLAQVVRLLKLHLTQDSLQVGLGGDEHRGPAVGGGGQALHHGLQVEQPAALLADELASLVHEEIEPETRRLAIEVLLHPGGEALDREAVAVLGVAYYFYGVVFAATELFGIGLGEAALGHGGQRIAVVLPAAAVHPLVGLLEGLELAALVEVVLELGHIALVAVVPLQLVEHLHEHFEDRCLVGAADAIELLIDVEQQAARRDRRCLLEVSADDLVLHLRQQDLHRPAVLLAHPLLAIQHQRKHLQQVRLTRAKEPRDPHAIGGGVVQVRVGEGTQPLAHLTGDDVLIQFDLQMALIVGLNHPVDRAVNRLGEEPLDGGGSHELLMSK